MNHNFRIAFIFAPVLIGIAVLGIHLLASYNALDRDVPIATENVLNAFRLGQLVENPFQHPSTTIGSHQWNDCLITLMAIDQRGDRMRLALSPIIPAIPQHVQADENPCAVLKYLVSGATPDPDLYYYDRYVHGAVVLLRYLLPHFEVKTIRTLYRTALSAILIVGFGLCLVGVAQGTRVPAFAVLAVTLLALMRFFGLESFSQSLGHGPADLVIGCYAAAIALMLFSPTGPVAAVLAAAGFGAFTMVFELFTGGIPLGFAMVLGLSSLAVRPDARPQGVRLAAWTTTAFLSAAAVVYLLKLIVVASVSDEGVVSDILQRLRYYSPAADNELELVPISLQVAGSVGVLVGGMTLLGWAAIVGSIAAGANGAKWIYRHVSDSVTRQHAALLVASVLPIPVWFLLFPNQVALHAWFMDRIFVWPIAAGFALFVLAIAARSRLSPQ